MTPPKRRHVLPLLTVLLLSASASVHAAPDDEVDGWTVFTPPVSTGTVVAPTTPEGGFGAPERTKLDQALRKNVLDQLCRQAQIPVNYNFGKGDFGGTGVGFKRYLRTDVDNQIAIVDDEDLHAGFSHGLSKLIGDTGASIGLSFGAHIEGHTMVVRRTGSTKSCDEVLRLADLRDVKTVLPMRGDRISNMALGELWRMPFTLTYSEGIGASDGITEENAAVNLSFGRSDSGAASMTLYRIAEDKLRFRFRIDHVVVYSRSLGITQTYPAIAFAANAQNILLKFVEREFARQLAQYTSAWMNWGQANSDGTKILMEFTIDPRDPEQAEALAKVVRGDMEQLVIMSAKMSTFQTKSTLADYLKLRGQNAEKLGPSTYAASDQYSAKVRSFTFNLPLIVNHNSAALFGEDKVDRYTAEGGQFHFYRADKSKNNSYFTLPWLGPMVKDNTQRDVETVTYAAEGQKPGDPIMVYIRNRGYLRVTGSTVREDVDEINSVMALTGARRGKDGSALRLPGETIVPPSPMNPGMRGAHGQDTQPTEPSDRKGLMSFTLAFNQQAVKDAVSASAAETLKAFAASVGADDRAMASWLAEHGAINAKGKLDYNWREAREAFPDNDSVGRGGVSSENQRQLDDLSRKAAGLIADFASIRNAAGPEERAQALATVVGGKGKSGLAYEEVLRVMVQFVDPMDITGDFVANVSVSTKGVKSPNQHFVLKKGRPEIETLKGAGDAKARFAEPSILTD